MLGDAEAVAVAPTKPARVTSEDPSGSPSRRTLTSIRRRPSTCVWETFVTQCHFRPANSTSPAVSSTEGIWPDRRTSVIRLSAIQPAKLRSRSCETLLTESPMVLNTASMPIATIASATTTSISVKPRCSGLFIAALDLDAAVDAADEGDARAAAAHQRQAIGRHLAAAPGDELRQPRIRVRLVAQQDRPPLEDELDAEVGRQLAWAERRVALDGDPALLEGVEALELVLRRLEQDAVVAPLELRLLLQQGDGVREPRGLALDLAILAEEADGQRGNGREDADDEEDNEDLDERQAAHR